MRRSVAESREDGGSWVPVCNKRSQIVLEVRHSRSGGFRFISQAQDITATVLALLRAKAAEYDRQRMNLNLAQQIIAARGERRLMRDHLLSAVLCA